MSSQGIFPVMPAEAGIHDITVQSIKRFLDSPSASLRVVILSNHRLRGKDKGTMQKLPDSSIKYHYFLSRRTLTDPPSESDRSATLLFCDVAPAITHQIHNSIAPIFDGPPI